MGEVIESKEDQPVRVYFLDQENNKFEEFELTDDIKLEDLLDSERLLYFIDHGRYQSFIWTGSETSTRSKFIAAKKAGAVRDAISPAINISTVDEGDETKKFRVFMGWEEREIENDINQTGPIYEGRSEHDELIQDLPLDKLNVILEKIGIPAGFQREFIIAGKEVLAYQEYYDEYMGEIIKERRLIRLNNKIDDGSYMAEDLVPRILMRYNKVICTELLKPLNQEDINKRKEDLEKIKNFTEHTKPFVENKF